MDGISIAAAPDRLWPLISTYGIFTQLMPDVREVRLAGDGRASRKPGISPPTPSAAKFWLRRKSDRQLIVSGVDGWWVGWASGSGRVLG
jgi:hypothetical protein